MATGTHSDYGNRTYLTVGFGKLRQKQLENKQKVDVNTPNAKLRKTQSGTESWALEFDFITGIIESIFYKEDSEYGNSYEVIINDAADTFQLSFQEESRFWQDLMKKLPNIDLSKEVKIIVYDFYDKENKRRVGTSIEQDGEKILSFYDKKEGDTWTLLYGFPSGSDVDFKDKDEIKMYFIKTKKFLRQEFQDRIVPKFNKTGKPDEPKHSSYNEETKNTSKQPDNEEDDGLPF